MRVSELRTLCSELIIGQGLGLGLGLGLGNRMELSNVKLTTDNEQLTIINIKSINNLKLKT